MRIKTELNEPNKCPKFEKKNSNANVMQIFAFALKRESQSGPEKQKEREMSSHCDNNSAHNVGGKY